MPYVHIVVRIALAQAEWCRAAGGRSGIVAWLMERAPLWVVVHVCMLLWVPE
jgi:hypothetical protein